MADPVALTSLPPATRARAAGYSRTAIALHWVMTLLILSGFTIGANMVDMRISPLKLRLYNYHKWIGITVLGLVLVRAAWRVTHRPPPDEPMAAWQRLAAHLTHGLLYALMVLVPLFGWLYSSATGYPVVYLSLWRLPDLVGRNEALARALVTVHAFLAWTLFYVVLLHVLAALKHHFWDRDATLQRMLRG